jgi:carbonic anhydrase/acetyltransferase-like protein (isoleucine patch superfamily)
MRLRQRWRRAVLVGKVRVAARRAGARVELDLAPDLLLGRDITITVMPGTTSSVRIGPGSRIEDRVLIMLKGGRLEAGPRMELRRDVVVNLAGVLRMDGDNPISWGSVVHCSTDVHLEPMAGIAEHCTIADSSHYFTTPDEHFWHNVRPGRVRVGRNTWICPKVTLTRSADVGSHCIVGAGSVVVGVVPDGHLASGVPATCQPLELPWLGARR